MDSNLKSSARHTAFRLMCWIAIDATLGATCGGLYGLVFGGFGALIHGEPWRLVSIAVYYAGWGIVIGTLVGTYGALFNAGGDAPGIALPSPNFVDKKQISRQVMRHFHAPGAGHTLASGVAPQLSKD